MVVALIKMFKVVIKSSVPLLDELQSPLLLRLSAHWNGGRREVWFVLQERLVHMLSVCTFISSSPKFTKKERSEGHHCHPEPTGRVAAHHGAAIGERQEKRRVYGTGSVCVRIVFCQKTKHKRRQSFSPGFGS